MREAAPPRRPKSAAGVRTDGRYPVRELAQLGGGSPQRAGAPRDQRRGAARVVFQRAGAPASRDNGVYETLLAPSCRSRTTRLRSSSAAATKSAPLEAARSAGLDVRDRRGHQLGELVDAPPRVGAVPSARTVTAVIAPQRRPCDTIGLPTAERRPSSRAMTPVDSRGVAVVVEPSGPPCLTHERNDAVPCQVQARSQQARNSLPGPRSQPRWNPAVGLVRCIQAPRRPAACPPPVRLGEDLLDEDSRATRASATRRSVLLPRPDVPPRHARLGVEIAGRPSSVKAAILDRVPAVQARHWFDVAIITPRAGVDDDRAPTAEADPQLLGYAAFSPKRRRSCPCAPGTGPEDLRRHGGSSRVTRMPPRVACLGFDSSCPHRSMCRRCHSATRTSHRQSRSVRPLGATAANSSGGGTPRRPGSPPSKRRPAHPRAWHRSLPGWCHGVLFAVVPKPAKTRNQAAVIRATNSSRDSAGRWPGYFAPWATRMQAPRRSLWVNPAACLVLGHRSCDRRSKPGVERGAGPGRPRRRAAWRGSGAVSDIGRQHRPT